jgi:hypothetical protein
MARRGHECRCCAGCEKCNPAPTLLVASVSYASGGGVIIQAGSTSGPSPISYGDVTASCVVEPARVGIASARITNQGSGYTSPPFFSVTGGGGSITFGTVTASFTVKSFTVTNGGSGYSQAPSVSPGLAVAVVEGAVSSVQVTSAGLGYQTPPAVSFGGGIDAVATATIDSLGRVTAVQIINGGSKYQPNPAVFFEGGDPTVPASAVATISGSVVRVDVVESQVFQMARNHLGVVAGTLPSVTFSGAATIPAQATASFEGRVTGMSLTPFNSSGYTSPPTISFSGGGGSGAQAAAELAWQQAHARTQEFDNCYAGVGYGNCVSASGSPSSLFGGACAGNRSEAVGWSASASTAADVARNLESPTSSLAVGTGVSWFFAGEAIFCTTSRSWGSSRIAETTTSQTFDDSCSGRGFFSRYSEADTEVYVRRFFSRVPPDTNWRIVTPDQGDATRNAVIVADYREYVDAKNDSVWYVESLTLVDGGSNLFIPANTSFLTLGCSNTRQQLSVSATVSYGVPQSTVRPMAEFTVQPTLAVVFELLPETGSYRISSITIEHGGETNAGDGAQIILSVNMSAGHIVNPPRMLAIVEDGRLDRIAFQSFGIFRGPATVTAIAPLAPDPQFNTVSRFITGESDRVVTRVHTVPTLTATAETVSGGGGLFSVQTEGGTDENGEAFWRVAGVTMIEPPTGAMVANPALIIEPTDPAIASVPAIAYLIPGRAEPDSLPSGLLVLDEQTSIPGFAATALAQLTDEFGDVFWQIESVQLADAAQDVTSVQVGRKVVLSLTNQTCVTGEVTVTSVDEEGRIAGFEISRRGQFFKPTDIGSRAVVFDGGRYFVRSHVVTEDVLPDPTSCIGPVTTQNGWQKNVRQRSFYDVISPQVGDSYSSRFGDVVGSFSRVRRCGLPSVSVELQ